MNSKTTLVREKVFHLTDEQKAEWLDFVPSFFYENERSTHHDFVPYRQIINCMITSIQEEFLTSEQQTKILLWKQKINKINNGIDEIFEEIDPCVISALLWTWLRLLEVMKQNSFSLKHLFSHFSIP